MWETICDSLHIPVARNVGSKFPECPHSMYFRNVGPPHPQWKFGGRSCHIEFDLVSSTPPPWKFGQILSPPTAHTVSGSSYMETNCCIPRGYRLVGLASHVREQIVLVNSCNLCESKYYRILVLLKWRNDKFYVSLLTHLSHGTFYITFQSEIILRLSFQRPSSVFRNRVRTSSAHALPIIMRIRRKRDIIMCIVQNNVYSPICIIVESTHYYTCFTH